MLADLSAMKWPPADLSQKFGKSSWGLSSGRNNVHLLLTEKGIGRRLPIQHFIYFILIVSPVLMQQILFAYLLYFKNFLATPRGTWKFINSSPTRDRTCTPRIGSLDSLLWDRQGNPCLYSI